MMQRVTPCTSFIFTPSVSSSVLLPVIPVPEDSSIPGQHGAAQVLLCRHPVVCALSLCNVHGNEELALCCHHLYCVLV